MYTFIYPRPHFKKLQFFYYYNLNVAKLKLVKNIEKYSVVKELEGVHVPLKVLCVLVSVSK